MTVGLGTTSLQAAPFAADVAVNGTTYQFQSVQNLLGSVPRQYLEPVTVGANYGVLGSASESHTPLGQLIRIDELSNGVAEVYAIFDKLGSVRTATLLGVNETPVYINSRFLGQAQNAYRPVNVGGPTSVGATPNARPDYSFTLPQPPEPQQPRTGSPVNPVPEPASLILFAAGALCLAKRRKG
ncbi:PEP-CTERM sorting domain-containing protein [Planctomycetota bacterium]|nr:PEP-CTERM sorting domain-containing protein [Planctomycetota bacterium]